MSQRTSETVSITPVVFWSSTKRSNCDHRSNWKGSPAVGSCWNSSARFEAYPVSVPSQYGEEPARACRCGDCSSREFRIGSTLSTWVIPTWTCTPQMSIWRPQYWVRSTSSA